jgi:DNA-nicking Smr family endonuclease
MARRHKAEKKAKPAAPPAKPEMASPLNDLPRMMRERREAEAKAAKIAAKNAEKIAERKVAQQPLKSRIGADDASASAPVDDGELLRAAYDGVRPLGGGGAARIEIAPPAGRAIVSEEAEVLAELSDLVAGLRPFELTETEEYVEGIRLGMDPRLVTRLRRGEFAIQAHIDLHGMTRTDAREALTAFIIDSARKGRRAILIVHGRGRNSPGGTPVLKHATAQWLSHGAIAGYVLAFTSARPADGGAGAMYVLMRRERGRARFDVLSGARRRD